LAFFSSCIFFSSSLVRIGRLDILSFLGSSFLGSSFLGSSFLGNFFFFNCSPIFLEASLNSKIFFLIQANYMNSISPE
jgi:hypothetical protein